MIEQLLPTIKDPADYIAALAAFLSGIGAGTLDRYTTLVGEVRMKCRR